MTAHATSSALNATDIARLIPHHGSMCLLAEVQSFDAEQIKCKAVSHRLPSNPLRENGVLHAVCGVEYAAQAMAVHGALLAKQDADCPPRGGRLASVRSVELSVSRLDDIDNDLDIQATHVMGDSNSMVYEFSVNAGERNLLKGKATVILMPPTSNETTT
jgi:predicted hotdog family 3-hydroxylacyl-ACP dehydratase